MKRVREAIKNETSLENLRGTIYDGFILELWNWHYTIIVEISCKIQTQNGLKNKKATRIWWFKETFSIIIL